MSDVACCMDEGNSCTIDWVVCSHVMFTANSTQSEMDMDNAFCSSVSFALLPPLVPSCLLALCKNKSTNVPNGFSIFDRQTRATKTTTALFAVLLTSCSRTNQSTQPMLLPESIYLPTV